MASGDLLASIFKAVPETTNGAVRSNTGAGFPVWTFDDATTETLYYYCYMSNLYDGSSGITVTIPWKFTTFVGSQTCDWEVSFYDIADDVNSIETFTFAAAQAVLATEASATGELDYAAVTFTNAQADSVQPGNLFVLRVVRDATGGTASPGDAEFTFPIIEQT